MPAHADSVMLNRLKSAAYYQEARLLDNYLDEFLDLIADSGYTDPETIVVKFRRGLNPQIQDTVATMASGRLSDTNLEAWYSMACTVDENRATNEAFASSSWTAPLVASRPVTSGSPFVKDKFDVWTLLLDELQEVIQDRLVQLDVAPTELVDPTMPVKADLGDKGDFLKLQQANCTPSLCNDNRFSVLSVDSITEIDEPVEIPQVVQTPKNQMPDRPARFSWEKHLPCRLVIAALEDGSRSLKLKVDIETTDTGEVKSLQSLVDSGVTSLFIDRG